MSGAPDFAPIAATLRRELEAYFRGRARDAADRRLRATIATNSDLVERRGRPLVAMLAGADAAALDGARVLDLGCGFGALSAYFAAHGARVVGIDVNASRFRVGRAAAAEHGLAVVLARGRIEAPPTLAEPFDVAVMNNTFCYLVEPELRRQALERVAALLAPGGVLLLRELNAGHPLDQFTRIPLLALVEPARAARIAGALRMTRPAVRIVAGRTLLAELRAAGFHDVRRLSDSSRLAARMSRRIARYQHVVGRR